MALAFGLSRLWVETCVGAERPRARKPHGPTPIDRREHGCTVRGMTALPVPPRTGQWLKVGLKARNEANKRGAGVQSFSTPNCCPAPQGPWPAGSGTKKYRSRLSLANPPKYGA